jgi:hypothetical protein
VDAFTWTLLAFAVAGAVVLFTRRARGDTVIGSQLSPRAPSHPEDRS